MRTPVSFALIALANLGCGSQAATTPIVDAAAPDVARDAASQRTAVGTRAAEGDGQTAPVNSRLPVAPAVQVIDAEGRGVEGFAVSFRVVRGDGRVEGESARSGPDGIARAGGWILGPVEGLQQVAARTEGLPEVTFSATAVPSRAGAVRVIAGDGQMGAAGAALAVDPEIEVVDGEGRGRAGVTVRARVTLGGGTASPAELRTDARGRARTRWTLGSAPGMQSLTLEAEGVGAVTLGATAVVAGEPTLDRTVVASGLSGLWDLAFLPGGAMLFTERGGRVRCQLPGDRTLRTVAEIADARPSGQSGVLGIAVAPDFATSREVFIYHSSNRGGAMDNRVSRWRMTENCGPLSDRADIVTGVAWGNGGAHSGGRLRFGPDGNLWLTSGDNRTGSIPQDLRSLGSKVMRFGRDGRAPADNPSIPNANPLIYAWGVRNVQGLDFNAAGEPVICEHGPVTMDEVTVLRPGANGGWNPLGANGSYTGYTGALMTDTGRFPDAVRPAWTLAPSAGMAGCSFVRAAGWGAWRDHLVVAVMGGRRLEVLRFEAGSARRVATIPTMATRVRSVVAGPDGALYVTTDQRAGGDEVWRFAPR